MYYYDLGLGAFTVWKAIIVCIVAKPRRTLSVVVWLTIRLICQDQMHGLYPDVACLAC